MNIRLEQTQKNIAEFERSIAAAREEFADWPEDALAAYLRPMIADLDQLRASVERELNLPSLRESPDLVWLTLSGGKVGSGRAPAHAIGNVLDSVQKGVRQLAAFIELGVAVTRRLSPDLSNETGLDLVAFAPGSAKLGLAPSIPQARLELDGAATIGGGALVDAAVSRFAIALSWAEKGGAEGEIEAILPDPTVRRQVLLRVREIAPTDRSPYESVEISGHGIKSSIGVERLTISGRAYERSTSYLKSRAREDVTYEGQLVAIDIEKDVFDLRYGAHRIHCNFPQELKDAALGLVSAFVEVSGEGFFEIDSEMADRVNVRRIRKLTMEEQSRL